MTLRGKIGNAMRSLGERLALGYDAGDSIRFRRDLGWDRATPRDEDSLTSRDLTLETIRLKAADMRRNDAVIAGLCDRLASHVVGTGILPQAKTSDRNWNKQAEAWWSEWSKVCDVRQRVNLWALCWQAVSLRPTHGGLYLELLENGQVRPIECERIRVPTEPEKAKAFPFGVKLDRGTGIVLGYWVHGRDENGTFWGEHQEGFVPRENMVPVIRPAWRPDQVREIPDLAPVVPVMQDVHDMSLYTLNTAKAQSMVIGVLQKMGGAGLNALPRGSTTQTVGARQTYKMDWGQIYETRPGEGLDLKASPVPGATHIPYMKLNLMLASAALDLPYEFFTLDFSSADFSRMKAVLLLTNRTMRNWQRWLIDTMLQRLWNWRIAKAIKHGDLPPAPTERRNGFAVSEWYKVDWQAPEEPWVDRQEANQADMLEWQLGLVPLSASAKRRGRDLEESLREKAANLQLAMDIEKEMGLAEGTLIKAQIPGQTETKPDA
jgi:capsid protein